VAAGLQSLVLGHGDSITQEPAMELEDAEFVVRLSMFAGLRKLAPLEPYRMRGNVAWSPAYARPLRDGRPRVLVVSPYLPFPLSHGGAVRIYNLCRELSREVDFILACFREANEVVRYPELHSVFREVHVVDIDEKYPYTSLPDQVTEYRNSAMADLVHRLCGDRQIDLVQLEYTQMAEYRKYAGSAPVLLVEHDITFTLYQQLAETPGNPRAGYQFKLWKGFERESLGAVDAVWTMSERDRDVAIENGSPRARTSVVPNGVDLNRFQPVRRQFREKTVLFVGSFRHLPNLLAYEALLTEIMPTVWAEIPDAKVQVIAGPNHEKAAKAARKESLLACDPRISIQGFVEDVRPAYRECDVVVIPLPVSAGTNIKLMEAMACGRAVVSTGVGCVGLGLRDGEELLVREIGPDFGQAVAQLLLDEGLRNRIAATARVTAEMRLGWDSISRSALKSYGDLTGRNFEQVPVQIDGQAVVPFRRRISAS
jgi:glycosyltransferase involved in cell wall biosynthesis